MPSRWVSVECIIKQSIICAVHAHVVVMMINDSLVESHENSNRDHLNILVRLMVSWPLFCIAYLCRFYIHTKFRIFAFIFLVKFFTYV